MLAATCNKVMKVLVTGASGFIGRCVCQKLASRGYEVVRVDRSPRGEGDMTVGDIGPATNWQTALTTSPDTIVHLAARVHVMRETPADALPAFRRTNVDGTLNLARQAVAAGVRRFVFLSSIKVNGEHSLPGRPFSADDEPDPRDAYAISKYEAEQCLLELAQETGLEVVIIRPPLVYGPGVKGNFAAMVNCVRRGFPLPLGAVRNSRSLVALENLADFIVLCADSKKSGAAANQVFLVSDDICVSTPELLKRIARAYGRRVILIPVPLGMLRFAARAFGRVASADRLLGSLVVNNEKAFHLLGWSPPITMENQLRIMANDDAAGH